MRELGAKVNLGIPPAYAGKSPRCRFCFLSLEDHHRLCGEKSICYDSTRPRPGSPPPMRGKAAVISPSKKFRRITPAYAGKSIENNAEAKAL